MQKRAITIQDISCVGRCSLTVALPILSAAGIETSILPTAILSTHTGGFTGYTFRDLTDDVEPIAAHWKTLGLHADAISTGYLGSEHQIELMQRFFEEFRSSDTIVMVDPAMADQGKLYPAFDERFAHHMASLCAQADIIVPNLTEAAYILDRPYVETGYDQVFIEQMLRELSALGPAKVVLTGVSFDDGHLGAASYDRMEDRFDYAFAERVEGYYHGTGDIYSSALLAALLNDKPLEEAIRIAVDFTVGAIKRTYADDTERRYGVDFEEELPSLIKSLGR